MEKKIIGITILFVLLLASIAFFAWDNAKTKERIKEYDLNAMLANAYTQGYTVGQADTIKIINTAIWNEVSTKGFLQLVDLDTNAQVILVPYQPQQKQGSQ
jgi:hypothetical protein